MRITELLAESFDNTTFDNAIQKMKGGYEAGPSHVGVEHTTCYAYVGKVLKQIEDQGIDASDGEIQFWGIPQDRRSDRKHGDLIAHAEMLFRGHVISDFLASGNPYHRQVHANLDKQMALVKTISVAEFKRLAGLS